MSSDDIDRNARRLVDEVFDGVSVAWPDPGSAALVPAPPPTREQRADLRRAKVEADAVARETRRVENARREAANREGRERRRREEAERLARRRRERGLDPS